MAVLVDGLIEQGEAVLEKLETLKGHPAVRGLFLSLQEGGGGTGGTGGETGGGGGGTGGGGGGGGGGGEGKEIAASLLAFPDQFLASLETLNPEELVQKVCINHPPTHLPTLLYHPPLPLFILFTHP